VFFRQTVLPLASRVGASLAQWLAPEFGDGLRVMIDTDRIDALAATAARWRAGTGWSRGDGGSDKTPH
jgi:phage portal protein BeeE